MKLSIKMPRMGRNATREGKPSGQAFASRYRGLILSILVFLALVFAILAFNYFGSRWANSHTEEVVAIADVQSRVDSIARGLQDLKLSALENPNTPYIRGIRSRMARISPVSTVPSRISGRSTRSARAGTTRVLRAPAVSNR